MQMLGFRSSAGTSSATPPYQLLVSHTVLPGAIVATLASQLAWHPVEKKADPLGPADGLSLVESPGRPSEGRLRLTAFPQRQGREAFLQLMAPASATQLGWLPSAVPPECWLLRCRYYEGCRTDALVPKAQSSSSHRFLGGSAVTFHEAGMAWTSRL